jgi:hypothetical protein
VQRSSLGLFATSATVIPLAEPLLCHSIVPNTPLDLIAHLARHELRLDFFDVAGSVQHSLFATSTKAHALPDSVFLH